MGVIPEKATYFFQNTYDLQSFPVFVAYLACIILIPLWRVVLVKPLELKKIMVVYNIFCVLLSFVAAFLLIYGAIGSGKIYAMEENEFVRQGLMVYTISKNVELLDTIFMILRQRWRQVSFLHVFHHSTILVLGNYAYVYTPYPPIAIVISLNSVVHVFLYTYYAMSALSSEQRPHWKKYMTQFQIAQFLFDLVFASIGYKYHGFCIYSIFYGLAMLVLFSNFYYHAYIKKREPSKKKE